MFGIKQLETHWIVSLNMVTTLILLPVYELKDFYAARDWRSS